MPIDRKLLASLRCPVSKRPLRPLTTSQLTQLNRAIDAGVVHSTSGRKVTEPVAEGLVTDSHSTIYRIDDGIPVMFEDDSIPVAQLDKFDDIDIDSLFAG